MVLKMEQAKNKVSVEQSVASQQHAQGRMKYQDTAFIRICIRVLGSHKIDFKRNNKIKDKLIKAFTECQKPI